VTRNLCRWRRFGHRNFKLQFIKSQFVSAPARSAQPPGFQSTTSDAGAKQARSAKTRRRRELPRSWRSCPHGPHPAHHRGLDEVLNKIMDMVFDAIEPTGYILLKQEGSWSEARARRTGPLSKEELPLRTICDRCEPEGFPHHHDAWRTPVEGGKASASTIRAAMCAPLWNKDHVSDDLCGQPTRGDVHAETDILTALANLAAWPERPC